jgi:hypothetical protein
MGLYYAQASLDQGCGFGVSIAKRSLLLPERISDGRTKKKAR